MKLGHLFVLLKAVAEGAVQLVDEGLLPKAEVLVLGDHLLKTSLMLLPYYPQLPLQSLSLPPPLDDLSYKPNVNNAKSLAEYASMGSPVLLIRCRLNDGGHEVGLSMSMGLWGHHLHPLIPSSDAG